MKWAKNIKSRVHSFIYDNRTVIKFIYLLIILNILALILESFNEMKDQYGSLFEAFEIFSIIVFSLEYLARLYTANVKGEPRSKFVFSFYGIVDLLAVLPFLLPFVLGLDLRVLRVLRLFRLIRIFKLGRYNESFRTIREVLKATKTELLMTVFIAFILLLISSTLMYYVESDIQPEKFKSIPHAFWWAIATLTTVGYGDVYPVTGMGRLLSSIIAIIGIGFVALPTGILSSAFMDRVKRGPDAKCEHCGKSLRS